MKPIAKVTLLVFITFITHIACAQFNNKWAFDLQNSDPLGGNVVINSIKVDSSGNSYITGYFEDVADFDPDTGIVNLSAYMQDIFIAKYDSLGKCVYAKNIGAVPNYGHGQGSSITIDDIGNAYVAGDFFGTVDFDPGPGIANLTATYSYSNVFIAKYDINGNYVYAKCLLGAGSLSSHCSSIAFDGIGNIFIAGYFSGTVDFDPGSGAANLTSAGHFDIFFAKYSSSSGNYIYAKRMGGVNQERANSLVVSENNLHITGFFESTVDFDPGAGSSNLTPVNGSKDIFLSKYDLLGNYIYAKKIGGSGSDIAESLSADKNGHVYITGAFVGTCDFDPGAGTLNLTSSGLAIFIARYDTIGNVVYAKNINGSWFKTNVKSIIVDDSSNVFITGYLDGGGDFDPGAGTVYLIGANNNQDIFFAKYDTSGNYLFAKKIGGPNDYDQGLCLGEDRKGNIYIGGTFSSIVDFDPGAGTANLIVGASLSSFVGKYYNNGNYGWAKAMGGYRNIVYNEEGKGITHDLAGNVYVTGIFQGTVDFDPGAGIANLTSAGNTDVFIAKYDASGNYLYAKSIGGTGEDSGNSIAVDKNGYVYITGTFKGTCDFDPGAGIVNYTSAGSTDIFIAGYDAAGNYLYAKAIGGLKDDSGTSIAVDNMGAVYVTGKYENTVDFDPGIGITHLTTLANRVNVFIAKYDMSGNYIYAKGIGGSGGINSNSIVIDNDGNAYIVGSFANTIDFDPDTGSVIFNPTNTYYNIFIAKYDASGKYVYAKAMLANVVNYNDSFSRSIAIDGDRNVYITGQFSSAVDFDPGPTSATMTSSGPWEDADIFIAKYDSLGNYKYARRMGGDLDDLGNSIAVDDSGNVYVTGYFTHTADFDPGAGTSNLISSGFSYDIFMAKYNASGNYVYAKRIGGVEDDHGNAIDVNGNGNVYLTGYLDSPEAVDFDPGAGVVNLQALNNQDVFIARYSECLSPDPDIPVVSSSALSICPVGTVTLSISSGNLNGATQWKWYNGNYAGTAIGVGSSIQISPTASTIYYVRGEGSCITPGLGTATAITIYGLPTVNISGSFITCTGTSANMTASGGSSYLWSTGATTSSINVAVPGTFTVVVTDVNGCVGSASATVTAGQAPVVSVSGNLAVCGAGSASLTANGGNSYLWSTGATTQSITVSTAGSLTVTAVDVNGCMNTTSVNVTVDSVPIIAIVGGTSICNGNFTMLTASGAASYTWNPATGLDNPYSAIVTANPTTTISYTVTGVSNGCNGETLLQLVVNTCTGIEDVSSLDNVSVYPNPTNGSLTIAFNNVKQGVVLIKVTDMIGNEVHHDFIDKCSNEYKTHIDLSKEAKGIYTINIIAGSSIFNRRIIVE